MMKTLGKLFISCIFLHDSEGQEAFLHMCHQCAHSKDLTCVTPQPIVIITSRAFLIESGWQWIPRLSVSKTISFEGVLEHFQTTSINAWMATSQRAHLQWEGGSELPHQIKERRRKRERGEKKESVWSTVREGKAHWGCVRAAAVVCERQRKRNENLCGKCKYK